MTNDEKQKLIEADVRERVGAGALEGWRLYVSVPCLRNAGWVLRLIRADQTEKHWWLFYGSEPGALAAEMSAVLTPWMEAP